MKTASGTQTRKNLGANVAYFVINIAIGIYLVPYFISTLGIAAYGLIPLATSLIGYVGLLTNSLNSAVSRHLTIDMQNPETAVANRTFNSAFFGLSKVIAVMIPAVLVISFIVPPFFGVPVVSSAEASMMFVGIGLAFLIRSWSSNFTVTLYGSNRLDLINFINLLNVTVQVVAIMMLFTFSGPSLPFVGASYLLGAIVATVTAYLMYRKLNQNISISYVHYDGGKFREMAHMGGWIIINDIGALLLLNIDLIVVNFLYGNAIGGEYSIAFQWVGLLRGLAATFISILGPVILISYAQGKRDSIVSISKSAVKLTGIGIALPIGLLCGFAPYVISAWVGVKYADLAPLMVLLTFHLVINTAVIPLFHINVAFNKVRLPALMTLITGVGNLVLALTLATVLGWGIYGVAMASVISLTLKNLLFTPIYASMVMGISKITFYSAVVPGTAAAAIIASIAYLVSLSIETPSLTILTILGGGIAIVYGLFSWRFLMNKPERTLIMSKARSS